MGTTFDGSGRGNTESTSDADAVGERDLPYGDLPEVSGAEFGNRAIEVRQVTVAGELSGVGNLLTGELVTISIEIAAHRIAEDFTVGFLIRDKRGSALFGTNSRLLGVAYDINPGQYIADFKFFNRFGEGSYFIDVDLHRGLSTYEAHYHTKTAAARFDVVGRCGVYFEGFFLLDVDTSIVSRSSSAAVSERLVQDFLPPTMLVGRLTPALVQFSARLRSLDTFTKLDTGTGVLVNIEVVNTSEVVWPATGKRPVHLSYRWYSARGDMIVSDGLRTRFPREIRPSQRVVVRGLLRAPETSGRALLVWELVQEHVQWFGEADPHSTCPSWVEVV